MKAYRQMLLPLAEHDTLTALAQLPFTEHEPFLDGTLTAFAQLPLAEHEPLQLDGPLRYFADAEAAYSFWKTAVVTGKLRAPKIDVENRPSASHIRSRFGRRRSHWRLLLGWTVEKRPASWIGLGCIFIK